MSKYWTRLAEMVGLEKEGPNWQKAAQKKNMQRWGTQDRRDKGMTGIEFMNKVRKGDAPPEMQQPNMTPKPGGLQIPSGTDRPGQGNPLMAPTPASKPVASRPELSSKPSSDSSNWMDMLMGDQPEED